jgi:hypothetical protein
MTDAEWKKHVERVRKICLGLPGVIEKASHKEPTFFTPDRVFAGMDSNHHGHWGVAMAAGPGVQEALLAERPEGFYLPKFVAKWGWIGVDPSQVGEDELGLLIHEAWTLTAKKSKPRTKRGALAKKK